MERKIAYIKDEIKDLSPEFLNTMCSLPNGNMIPFRQYCEEYVPTIMDNNFRLTANDFIESLDDLIMMQQFESGVEARQVNSNSKDEYIDSILRSYSEEELNYVINLKSGGKLLKDYIIELGQQMDDNHNIRDSFGFIMSIKDEVQRAYEEGKLNQRVAEEFLNNINRMQGSRINLDFLEQCIKSVSSDFGKDNIFYKAGMRAIDNYLSNTTSLEEKNRLINNLQGIDFKNTDLRNYANDRIQEIKRSNFAAQMLEELESEPIMISEAKTQIERLISSYENEEHKSEDYLFSLINSMGVHRSDIEVYFSKKEGGFSRDDMIYMDRITSIEHKMKRECEYISELNRLKRKIQNYQEEFHFDKNPDYEQYYLAYLNLIKELEEVFTFASNYGIQVARTDANLIDVLEDQKRKISNLAQTSQNLRAFH